MRRFLQILGGIVALLLTINILILMYSMVLKGSFVGGAFMGFMLGIVYFFIRSLPLKTEKNYKTYISFCLIGLTLFVVVIEGFLLLGTMGYDMTFLITIMSLLLIMWSVSIYQGKKEFNISIKEMLNKKYE